VATEHAMQTIKYDRIKAHEEQHLVDDLDRRKVPAKPAQPPRIRTFASPILLKSTCLSPCSKNFLPVLRFPRYFGDAAHSI
jgi:hypothetical protein